jgi:hypothetical protein
MGACGPRSPHRWTLLLLSRLTSSLGLMRRPGPLHTRGWPPFSTGQHWGQAGAHDDPNPAGLAGLLPSGLLDSPPESPPAALNPAGAQPPVLPDAEQPPVLPDAEQSTINNFLQLNIQLPEAPLLQHPPIQPP